MKRCPECRRDYYDETLLYCLDDGDALLDGPASVDGPATAIIREASLPSETATRAQIITTDNTAVFPAAQQEVLPRTASRKNSIIAGIFGILLVSALGVGSYLLYGRPNTRQIESIAVMPFVNESGNVDVEYLSDGMTETLISSLSQLPNLNVKARSSVFRYKGKETDALTVGKELNVQAILTGRVVSRGQDLVLYVELVDAATENSLWKQSYNKSITNLVALQNEIARDVAEKLKVKLSGAEEQKLGKSYTSNAEAYKLYLEGRFFINKRSPENLRKAIELFNQAIAIDPNYALAFTGLADAYALLPNAHAAQPREVMPKAREAALKALSIDSELAEAHSSLGYVLIQYDYNFTGGEREYRRAIELNPRYTAAHQWLGELLVNQSRFEEGFAEFKTALELEPFSLPANFSYGVNFINAARYPEAVAQLKKTLEMDTTFQGTLFALALAYEANGNYAESVEMTVKSLELLGMHQDAAALRDQFSRTGWAGVLPARNKAIHTDMSPFFLAADYAQQGEKDKAFAELEKAYESRTFLMTLLKVNRRFDPIRGDPRFQEMLRKVGFPD